MILQDDGRQVIRLPDASSLTITGYRGNARWRALASLGILLSGGVLALLFYWRRDWWLFATHDNCLLECADSVTVTGQYGELTVKPILTQQQSLGDQENEWGSLVNVVNDVW